MKMKKVSLESLKEMFEGRWVHITETNGEPPKKVLCTAIHNIPGVCPFSLETDGGSQYSFNAETVRKTFVDGPCPFGGGRRKIELAHVGEPRHSVTSSKSRTSWPALLSVLLGLTLGFVIILFEHSRIEHRRTELAAFGLIEPGKVCPHGNQDFCGLCAADKSPKCRHGNPFYCGTCGLVPPK